MPSLPLVGVLHAAVPSIARVPSAPAGPKARTMESVLWALATSRVPSGPNAMPRSSESVIDPGTASTAADAGAPSRPKARTWVMGSVTPPSPEKVT